MMASPIVSVRQGLRIVEPHNHTVAIRAKGRWFDRTVLDVLSSEFRSRTLEQHKHQILHGGVQLVRTGEAVTVLTGQELLGPPSVHIRNKDTIHVTTHKHEPPVLAPSGPITLLHYDNAAGILVVNKPCSIPVHPTGKYFHNTLTEMLKVQLNLKDIYPCHRLDRLTSGVLIMATSSLQASRIQERIRDKQVQKLYLARVQGRFSFPDNFKVDRPIGVIDTKLGFENGVKPRKEAVTEFELVRYNEDLDQSIVRCKPLTGRTHQIRIHLNHLGFPIVNDPLYGPHASKLRSELINSDEDITKEKFDLLLAEDLDRLETIKASAPRCEECGDLLFNYDKIESGLQMWLHSYKFVVDKEMQYETGEPEWCSI